MQVGLALIHLRKDDILRCKSFMATAQLFQDLGSKSVDFSELMTTATSPEFHRLHGSRCIHAMRCWGGSESAAAAAVASSPPPSPPVDGTHGEFVSSPSNHHRSNDCTQCARDFPGCSAGLFTAFNAPVVLGVATCEAVSPMASPTLFAVSRSTSPVHTPSPLPHLTSFSGTRTPYSHTPAQHTPLTEPVDWTHTLMDITAVLHQDARRVSVTPQKADAKVEFEMQKFTEMSAEFRLRRVDL